MTDFATNPNPESTPVPPELVTPTPPVIPSYIPKRKAPILPLLFGFLIVITIAAAMGIAYYKTKLTTSSVPSPSPTATATPTPEPSVVDSSAAPSGSPKSSLKPSSKPTSSVTASPRLTTQASPTPTPVPQPTLDIRFGNPSANIKQTIDEGTGDGRVINREYTSIQAGQFDEVSSTWSPRVTVCYHIVSDEDVAGKDVKFSLTVDDKVEVEDNLGGYDKLAAGRIYDWCHDVTTSIGKHTARLTLNPDKSLKEYNYTNSLGRVDWENLSDKIAPNFSLGGPYNWNENGTCFIIVAAPTDNVTPTAQLKVEEKVDSGSWTTTTTAQYCFKGVSGSSHTYAVKVTDARGNASEQSKTFELY